MPGFKTTLIILTFLIISTGINGQITMGILPANLPAANSPDMDERQWQSFSSKLHDCLVNEISGKILVTKLTREHILLLLKDKPVKDAENPDAEAIQTICKKERLQYLLKYSIESLPIRDKTVNVQSGFIILDGNSGKVFWEKNMKTSRTVSSSAITEQVLFEEVFKPLIHQISEEIKMLNY